MRKTCSDTMILWRVVATACELGENAKAWKTDQVPPLPGHMWLDKGYSIFHLGNLEILGLRMYWVGWITSYAWACSSWAVVLLLAIEQGTQIYYNGNSFSLSGCFWAFIHYMAWLTRCIPSPHVTMTRISMLWHAYLGKCMCVCCKACFSRHNILNW